ncbi:hypothetical protein ABIB29_001858 [Arthrobacter sp. UYEF36]
MKTMDRGFIQLRGTRSWTSPYERGLKLPKTSKR